MPPYMRLHKKKLRRESYEKKQTFGVADVSVHSRFRMNGFRLMNAGCKFNLRSLEAYKAAEGLSLSTKPLPTSNLVENTMLARCRRRRKQLEWPLPFT